MDGIIGNEIFNATDATLVRAGAGTLANPYTLDVGTGQITTVELANNAVTTTRILDANVTPPKIAPGGGVRILRTNAAGNAVAWVDLPAGGAVSSDGTTILGDGSATDLSVPTGGITAAQILDGAITAADIGINAVTTTRILNANVTEAKIAPGRRTSRPRTNGAGTAVAWVDLPAGGAVLLRRDNHRGRRFGNRPLRANRGNYHGTNLGRNHYGQ